MPVLGTLAQMVGKPAHTRGDIGSSPIRSITYLPCVEKESDLHNVVVGFTYCDLDGGGIGKRIARYFVIKYNMV